MWDATAGRELFSWAGHAAALTGVAFSPDGWHLVSTTSQMFGRGPGEAVLWHVGRRQEVVWLPHAAGVSSAAFSPDGKRLATGSSVLSVWELGPPALGAGR